MKKLIVVLVILLLCGCSKKEFKPVEIKEKTVDEFIEKEPDYTDSNQTPIGFYQLQGNTLKRVSMISGNYQSMDDVLFLQIFPANEEMVTLTDGFANQFYQTWISYHDNMNVKIGFSLEFSLDNGETIFYNILSPSQTMEHWEFFMAYLYDDYVNQGKSFYSHIEENEYNDSTLFTAFKLQCGGDCIGVSSKVQLTVFTYDGEDDFLDHHYRGNSQSTVTICLRDGIC